VSAGPGWVATGMGLRYLVGCDVKMYFICAYTSCCISSFRLMNAHSWAGGFLMLLIGAEAGGYDYYRAANQCGDFALRI
jgi:hypothetical protein